MIFLAFVAPLLFSSSQAAALPGLTKEQPVCFGREYSTPHMQKHPAQTVKQLRLKFAKFSAEESVTQLEIDAKISLPSKVDPGTKVTKAFSTSMYCFERPRSFECAIDCDGGKATVKWQLSGSEKEMTFVNEGLILEGGCDEENPEIVWLDPKKGGDDVFKLYALPETFCQK